MTAIAATRPDSRSPSVVSAVGVVACIMLALANNLIAISAARRLLALIGIALFAWEFLRCARLRPADIALLLLFLLISSGFMLNTLAFGWPPREGVYLIVNVGVAIAVCRGVVGSRIAGWLTSIVSVYFAARLWRAGGYEAIQEVLSTGSANGITEMTIALSVLYVLLCTMERRTPGLWAPLLATLANALTLGRSGMAASAILLLAVAFANVGATPSAWRRGLKVALLATGALVIAVWVLPLLIAVLNIFERFVTMGLESDRSQITAAYFARLEPASLLFGFSPETTFAGFTNLHNSYLLWHRSLGAVAFVLYLVVMAALGRLLWRKPLLGVALLALLLRSFFDETMLPYRLFDFVLLSVVGYAFGLPPAAGDYPLEDVG